MATCVLAILLYPTGFAFVAVRPINTLEERDLAKEQMDAAKEAYELAFKSYEKGPTKLETVYLWSRRWMEAQREASAKKADQVAAIEAHLERMKKLQELAKKKAIEGATVSTFDRAETRFYTIEAELWLRKAKK